MFNNFYITISCYNATLLEAIITTNGCLYKHVQYVDVYSMWIIGGFLNIILKKSQNYNLLLVRKTE